MSKYDGEMLKEIDDRADLIAYIQQNYEVEHRGDDLYMHCPKHQDDTPSLSFSIKDGFYHCFSCGRSGRMIWWLYDYEGLSFDKAVEKAAKLAEVDLQTMCQSDAMIYLKKVGQCFSRKRQKFQHTVINPAEYNKYKRAPIPEWEEEGIDPAVMKLFDIRLDERQNRIVYPVYDIDGNLINVKGRTRYDNYKALKLQKYINYYKVGKLDYFQCLNRNLTYVKEKREIIVFESIKSVMKAYGWGYKNCVSAETHSLSDEQIDLLIKLKVNVVLAWDSDVDKFDSDVQDSLKKLKQFTDVFYISDKEQLLGGKEAKNAPVDCGKEIWETLYEHKRKVV